jgi:hypothetical protein
MNSQFLHLPGGFGRLASIRWACATITLRARATDVRRPSKLKATVDISRVCCSTELAHHFQSGLFDRDQWTPNCPNDQYALRYAFLENKVMKMIFRSNRNDQLSM